MIVGHIIQTFLTRYGVMNCQPANIDTVLSSHRSERSLNTCMDGAEDCDALLAQMNQEVNRYKNMVIKLQADLRRHQSRMD